jgi:hypothetical protein
MNQRMIKIEYKIIVTIAALASILVVNTVAIGTDGHIALASHYDKTNVFKSSHINVQTDTDQECETAGGTSPISDSCSAASTNTISQGVVQSPTQGPPSRSCPTTLTLTFLPFPTGEELTGTLTDCTGKGVASAIITFTGSNPNTPTSTVTGAGGTYSIGIGVVGTYTIQAHFAGSAGLGPSNSATVTFTIVSV